MELFLRGGDFKKRKKKRGKKENKREK